jgi:hypothetical protein
MRRSLGQTQHALRVLCVARVPYVLHILTHGRRYHEEYDSLDEALAAAAALEHEPRERAESITFNGEPCLDRAAIEAHIRSKT